MTREQYKRSGRVAYVIVMVACSMVLLTLVAAIFMNGLLPRTVIQMVSIGFAMLVATVTYLRKDYTKRGMILLAGMGAWMYFTVSIFNGANISFIYGFVILFCCMAYMNKRLLIWGNSFMAIGFAIRCVKMYLANNMDIEFIALGWVTILLCSYASVRAVSLLLKYNEENVASITEQAEQQREATVLMSKVAEEINSRFAKATGRMEELESAMQVSDRGVQDIALSMTSVSQSIQDEADMCSSIQKNVSEIDIETTAMNQSSDKVKETIIESAEIVNLLQEQANTVNESNQSTVDSINRLAKKVAEVENITNTILSISSQTNLLALNASIEAARAGEAGRGFAVVADEIRKLSEDTRESANQITGIIGELVADVGNTTSIMRVSSKTIDEQGQMIVATKDKFELIESEVTELIQNIKQTEVLMKDIVKATGVINESVSDLSAVSEEVAASSEESASISAQAVDSIGRVNHELRQIRKLAEKLIEATA